MKYLLTYKDSREICKRYNNTNFWESQYMIDGYKVSTFNYFICGWNDFNNPLPHKPNVKAFDMRGTTFVFDKTGKIFETFYMLPKFFNINQVEETQYDKIKDKKIDTITVKEDGSLVTFMLLPNDKIFAKTIGSFTSEQSQAAYKLLCDNKKWYDWVLNCLKSGFTPLFEYVSWDNRIVLKYSKPELRYIGVRNNLNSDIIFAPKDPTGAPKDLLFVKEENNTLDELIDKSKKEENCEGWVVKFKDGQMIKIKTQWYFYLHVIRTESVFREDYIINNYLNETLDDVMTQLDPKEDADAFEFVDSVCNAINKYIKEIDQFTYKLKKVYKKDHNSDWTSFAIHNHKEPYFGLSNFLIYKPEEYAKRKIEFIIKRTSKLKKAKELVEKYKN